MRIVQCPGTGEKIVVEEVCNCTEVKIDSPNKSVDIKKDDKGYHLEVEKGSLDKVVRPAEYNTNPIKYYKEGRDSFTGEGAFLPWYDYTGNVPEDVILVNDIKTRIGSADSLGNGVEGTPGDDLIRLNQKTSKSNTISYDTSRPFYLWAIEQFETLFAVKNGIVTHVGKKARWIGNNEDEATGKVQINWTRVSEDDSKIRNFRFTDVVWGSEGDGAIAFTATILLNDETINDGIYQAEVNYSGITKEQAKDFVNSNSQMGSVFEITLSYPIYDYHINSYLAAVERYSANSLIIRQTKILNISLIGN
ncbi:hypothetical protein BG262_02910 [Floricoccus penangensis]|uniref:Uncharacterized protein n=1 Tax=Floricoccus penangensis TaxID=1859475 RepID=A0A9Q5JGN9_9LACT|nr:hypothetical protein [Floricoccus penangensis]OFI46765.1 hypothetical protein BG262_02910 [Floricoccus penangensis]